MASILLLYSETIETYDSFYYPGGDTPKLVLWQQTGQPTTNKLYPILLQILGAA